MADEQRIEHDRQVAEGKDRSRFVQPDEVVTQIDRAIRGDVQVYYIDKPWTNMYGEIAFMFGDWRIVFYNDGSSGEPHLTGDIDYVDSATAPDGRREPRDGRDISDVWEENPWDMMGSDRSRDWRATYDTLNSLLTNAQKYTG